MLDVIKFYFDLIGKLMSDIWGSFHITENVTFLQFFFVSQPPPISPSIFSFFFIAVLRFGFGSNGISEFKQYSRNKELREAKHRYKGKHEE